MQIFQKLRSMSFTEESDAGFPVDGLFNECTEVKHLQFSYFNLQT